MINLSKWLLSLVMTMLLCYKIVKTSKYENEATQFEVKLLACNSERQPLETYIVRKYGNVLHTSFDKNSVPIKMDVITFSTIERPLTEAAPFIKLIIHMPATEFEVYVDINEFWNGTECISLWKREADKTLSCISINLDYKKNYKECFSVKIIFSENMKKVMKMFYPITKPPKLIKTSKSNKLHMGDTIECHYEKKVFPKPTIHTYYEGDDPHFEKKEQSEKTVLVVTKTTKSGVYSVSCLAVNVIDSLIFAFSTTKTFEIEGPPEKLIITPWKQTIFSKGSKIECRVVGKNSTCKWNRISGKSVLKTESNRSQCFLHISESKKDTTLKGGMYEWVCCGVGPNKYGYIFQRKIFYIFIPLRKKPSCRECSKGKYANVKGRLTYQCIIDDPYHYPQALITWKVIQGTSHYYQINENILTLIEKDSSDSIVMSFQCQATDIQASTRVNRFNHTETFWKTYRSKTFKFKSPTISCPQIKVFLLQITHVILITIIFVASDIILYYFLHQKRIQEYNG